MLTSGVRSCDVCDDEIGRGATYYRANLRPEAAAMLIEAGEFSPTFSQNPDGTVRLDICLDCYGNMGHVEGAKTIN